jgi:hypothetical protein
MPDVWMPGLIHDPGSGAGYNVGRNQMRLVCVHFTAGVNSYELVKNGNAKAPSTLAQFLLPKMGVPWQFTEVDALCYDSPPNTDGPGIEFERMGYHEPLTSDQLEWGGRIFQWLHDEWGVPLVHYDGPKVQGTIPGFHGFANHGDLDRNRSDGVTPEEWDALIGGDMAIPDEQMQILGQWMQDMRNSILSVLTDTKPPEIPTSKGLLATWENDTRAVVREEVKKVLDELEAMKPGK